MLRAVKTQAVPARSAVSAQTRSAAKLECWSLCKAIQILTAGINVAEDAELQAWPGGTSAKLQNLLFNSIRISLNPEP